MVKKLICLLLLNLFGISQIQAQKIKIAYLTDLHIHSDSTLNEVKKLVNKIDNVDFFLSGGDNVDIDVLNEKSIEKGKSLYKDLKSIFTDSKKLFYPTIGNHDRLPTSLRNSSNVFEVFEENFGNTYYSFVQKNYKFIVLNSVETRNGKYEVGEKQIAWLTEELKNTDKNQALIVLSHVPFLSVYNPVINGNYSDADIVSNQKTVLDLFKNHNLKLVLQGHMHLYEEIKVKNIDFITAGAVSGNWWNGAYFGTEPGYLEIEIDNEDIKWIYKHVK